MKFSTLECPVRIGKMPVVIGLTYTPPVLTILYDPDAGECHLRITFDQCRGFRCLDEGDLLRYWEDRALADGWFAQILEGGWLTDESENYLDVTQGMGIYREYLLASQMDCVTVLSTRPPRIEVVPNQAAV